ncbi:hypothetical protein GOP47_0029625 [Adiantum capillus-veneris]|nr:hypothetical protein GOP47_0029625 [Adiantum capillus-veneris]
MNGMGRLSKPVVECNAGAPTSSSGTKRPYFSPLQRVSPPARIALVVLLCAQIMFLAIVRLGPSASVWGGQGSGSSVQASTKTIRNSLLLSGMSMETQAFSDKESKASSEAMSTGKEIEVSSEAMSTDEVSSEVLSTGKENKVSSEASLATSKKRAHRKEKSTSKHKATKKKMLLKKSAKSETERINVAHADQSKGSGDTELEVGRSLRTKEQSDDLLPSVDDKFLADTAIKESFNARSNSDSEGSTVDISVKKEDESLAVLDDTVYVDPSFSSMRKAHTNSRAKHEHDQNASKIKQAVSGMEAQTRQGDQESDGSTSNAPENSAEKEEQNVGSGENVEEAVIDTSAGFQDTKQEGQPAVAEEQNIRLGGKVEEAASDTSVEFQATKKGQQVVVEEASENDVSKIKLAEEGHGPRDSEKEQSAPSVDGVEEALFDGNTDSKDAKQGTLQISTAEEASESATPITKSATEERSVEELQAAPEEKENKQGAVKEAVLIEQKGHEEMSSSQCTYGYIYVYDLPPAFNHDIISNCTALNPWFDLCPTLSNGGLGEGLGTASPLGQEGSWYASDQFNAEIIFHNRILQHECLTDKMEVASAFYMPFYAGLDVGRYLHSGASIESRDRLSNQFADWLSEQPAWKKSSGGVDHFMMVGRITWDFRRFKEEDWGSGFFTKPAMQNITKLLIERNPWDSKEMGVPYPTNFHPQSDSDLLAWQNHIKGLKRNYLFSFAGAPRDKFPNDFRRTLFEQCSQAKQCRSLDCSNGTCEDNQKTMEFFMDSTFCLQPRGDSFTRRSTFDCLLAGSIPVFFWHRSAYMQYEWHLPADEGSYSVFVSKQDVRDGTKIEDVLKAIAPEKVQAMQEAIIQLIPKVVYAVSGFAIKEKDAFDVAIEGVMRSLKGAKASLQ